MKRTLLNRPTCRSSFLEEDVVAEALIRYYQVKEVLLPPRKLGERIPSLLMEFYNNLMSEMAYSLSSETIENKSVIILNGIYQKLKIRKNSTKL